MEAGTHTEVLRFKQHLSLKLENLENILLAVLAEMVFCTIRSVFSASPQCH